MTLPEAERQIDEGDPIAVRAAELFERRRFGAWSLFDQAELDAWLAESLWHRAAYLRVEGIAARASELAALRPLEPGLVRPGRARRIAAFRYALPLLAAASIAFVAALELPVLVQWLQPPDRIYSTDVGGRTLLSFGDHTQIELNTDTTARFRMTTRERTVWLEKGEAWFHVAHNAAYPFTVIVGNHRVTDLGTEFVVRRGGNGLEVALLSGCATLSTDGAPTATLKPGDDAVATTASLSIIRKSPLELADALAWRRGVLVFRKAPLAEVVRQFNRYNTTKLVIADPEIANEPFSADLRTDDFDSFLRLAKAVLDLRTERVGNEILISRGTRDAKTKAAHIKRGD
jgi:transmembrane sensor